MLKQFVKKACATKHASAPKMNAREICRTPNVCCPQDFAANFDWVGEVDWVGDLGVGSKDSVSACWESSRSRGSSVPASTSVLLCMVSIQRVSVVIVRKEVHIIYVYKPRDQSINNRY